MMRTYNTEKAIVFNTYQCYLKKAHKTIILDLEQVRYIIIYLFTFRFYIYSSIHLLNHLFVHQPYYEGGGGSNPPVVYTE